MIINQKSNFDFEDPEDPQPTDASPNSASDDFSASIDGGKCSFCDIKLVINQHLNNL